MFTARATEVTGAPDVVQAGFLLESRLDLVTTTEPVYLGRERGTGQRFWIKCPDGTAESDQRITGEHAILGTIQHPHVLQLVDEPQQASTPFLLFAWQAEQPLTAALLDELPATDRVRLAADVLDVIQHLQTMDQPVVHGSLDLENLWATPLVRWVRLAGFNRAQAGAPADDLQADRRSALKLLGQLIGPEEPDTENHRALRTAAELWAEDPAGGYGALGTAIRQVLLDCITADL